MSEKIKIGVKIMPRDVILDTQGRAVEQTLKLNSMPEARVRVGKFIELEFVGSLDGARKQAEIIARTVLINPLIETFELSS
jgi:phosphoribosylformylglycinamidine (FGAM) synthase PurS component